MKRFLLKVFTWVFPIVAVHLWLATFADGNTDDNYLKFVRQSGNIITGDSRGAQAIVSPILKSNFPDRQFDNFSLNITHSPYGKIYYDAIIRKLDKNGKNGIFILTVDPWNLSQDKGAESFTEEGAAPDNMRCYRMNPNYEYLLKNYRQSWFHIYRDRASKRGKSATYLHNDGWLEVTVSMDSAEVAAREGEKIGFYQRFASGQQFSKHRLFYFEKTIELLKNHGDVYIVRIPGSPKLQRIEDSYAPEFNRMMRKIAGKYGINYFDMSTDVAKYLYTDGNHMYKESGKIMTQQIADSIKSLRFTKTDPSGN